MQARTVFQTILGGALLFFAACQFGDDNTPPLSESNAPFVSSDLEAAPKSVHYFSDAEQKLALKEYTFAAAQLHKGIIAYRVETGKMWGQSAKQANKAIDTLTFLRQKLRKGKPVRPGDLHKAIQQALAVEGTATPSNQGNTGESLAIPVGN